jgi:hypothetical protein
MITLVGCSDNDELDYYICKDDSKPLMKEFSMHCLENVSSMLKTTIVALDKTDKINSRNGYSYNERVRSAHESSLNTYEKIVARCSYAAKRMFCMEPLKNKEKDE